MLFCFPFSFLFFRSSAQCKGLNLSEMMFLIVRVENPMKITNDVSKMTNAMVNLCCAKPDLNLDPL